MKKLCLIFMVIFSFTIKAEQNFEYIVNTLFKFEGTKLVKAEDGYSKYGLTKYYYNDIPNLTESKAKEIIFEKVYLKHNINKIESLRLKHLIFDFLYHTNPIKVVRMINTLCNKYNSNINPKSSKITEDTLQILNSSDDIFYQILEIRKEYIRNLKMYKKYGKGWEKRLQFFEEVYNNTEYMER